MTRLVLVALVGSAAALSVPELHDKPGSHPHVDMRFVQDLSEMTGMAPKDIEPMLGNALLKRTQEAEDEVDKEMSGAAESLSVQEMTKLEEENVKEREAYFEEIAKDPARHQAAIDKERETENKQTDAVMDLIDQGRKDGYIEENGQKEYYTDVPQMPPLELPTKLDDIPTFFERLRVNPMLWSGLVKKHMEKMAKGMQGAMPANLASGATTPKEEVSSSAEVEAPKAETKKAETSHEKLQKTKAALKEAPAEFRSALLQWQDMSKEAAGLLFSSSDSLPETKKAAMADIQSRAKTAQDAFHAVVKTSPNPQVLIAVGQRRIMAQLVRNAAAGSKHDTGIDALNGCVASHEGIPEGYAAATQCLCVAANTCGLSKNPDTCLPLVRTTCLAPSELTVGA